MINLTKYSTLTLADLLTFARREARLTAADDGINFATESDFRRQRYEISKDKAKALGNIRYLVSHADEIRLPIGASYNGRLEVKRGEITYCAGQYSPTEIWAAVGSYISENRENI